MTEVRTGTSRARLFVTVLLLVGLAFLSRPAWALEVACINGLDDDMDGAVILLP